MRAFRLSNILAAVAVLIGGVWGLGVAMALVREVIDSGGNFDSLLIGIKFGPLVMPAVFFLYFGGKALVRKDIFHLKSLSVLYALAAVMLMFASSEALWSEDYSEVCGQLCLFLSTLLVAPVYVRLASHLIRTENLEYPGVHCLLGRGFILILSLELWFLLFHVGKTFVEQERIRSSTEIPWNVIGVLGPVLIAWPFYYFGLGLLQPRESNGKSVKETHQHADA